MRIISKTRAKNGTITGLAVDAIKLNIKKLPDVLLLREVADLVRVSPLTLKRWEKRGDIKCFRINRRGDRRYLKADILKMFKK